MKLKDGFPTILFPIEITTRELDSKLVIASALAAQGCRAIVGHKEVLRAIGRASSGVVWLGKSLFSRRSSDHLVDHLVKRGSAIIFLHDEGGIFRVRPWAQRLLRTHYKAQEVLRTHYLNDRNVDRICVWGTKQKELLSSYVKEFSDNIKVTGSPNFDLCLPRFSWITEQKSEDKRSRYGPFFLMCTRFGRAASGHSRGQARPFRNLAPGDQSLDLTFDDWRREVHDFADFVLLIKEIAINYPRHTIILRPHPSENISFYEAAFASVKNVVVTREGSVLSWIRPAELVVHSNCTTGVEAVLAGRPVLNLLPGSDDDFDVEVAREAGSIAKSIDEALRKTQELLADDAPPRQVWSPHAQTILHNLNHEAIPILVAETMSVIQEARITASNIELPGLRLRTVLPRPKLLSVMRRFGNGGGPKNSIAKRLSLDPGYVDTLLQECRSRHFGKGRIEHLTKQYVVVGPA